MRGSELHGPKTELNNSVGKCTTEIDNAGNLMNSSDLARRLRSYAPAQISHLIARDLELAAFCLEELETRLQVTRAYLKLEQSRDLKLDNPHNQKRSGSEDTDGGSAGR